MYVATAAEMRNIDSRTMGDYAVPGIVLMENAGLQLLRTMQECIPTLAQQRVAIITGQGNNGGDGFVLARHLWQRGIAVRVYLVASGGTLRGDARLAYRMARAYGVPMVQCTTLRTWKRATRDLQYVDLIVDALLGTGLNKPVTGVYAEVIQTINALRLPVVAVDIPSGLSADDGNLLGPHVQATHTVTFALPKRGLLLYPAATAVGQLHVVNIGIPHHAIDAEQIQVVLLEEQAICTVLPGRRPDAHKGSHGHLLVVAGSLGKTGAAVLASQAALRSGAGLVTLALPASLNMAVEACLTEVMTLPLPEYPPGAMAQAAVPELGQFLQQSSALVLGPGLGTRPETVAGVHALLRYATVPVVLDADGLNSLVGHLDILQHCRGSVILTPHPGEMARLVGTSTQAVQQQRLEVARSLAEQYRVHVVLKGAGTVIYAPNGQRWINPTGNAAMATAGTGDVLAGIIGALLCQGLDALRAAQCGVFLHGLAGDRVRDRVGQHGLIASDILEELPYVRRTVQGDPICGL
ncbi:Bifunctional NAD(P)H-hydrate repair enzyme Nnr [Candidatus Entotheonellaceae bacterium PAL068K]